MFDSHSELRRSPLVGLVIELRCGVIRANGRIACAVRIIVEGDAKQPTAGRPTRGQLGDGGLQFIVILADLLNFLVLRMDNGENKCRQHDDDAFSHSMLSV